MRLLWQKAILETMMLIHMNRETRSRRRYHVLLLNNLFVFLVLDNVYSLFVITSKD